MTPNDIEVLLHYHVSPCIHPRYDAPAVKESIENFLTGKILEPYRHADGPNVTDGPNVFSTTKLGAALVAMLCQTPYPIVACIDPRTSEVVNV